MSDLTRRSFLRLGSGLVIGLLIKPTAVFSDDLDLVDPKDIVGEPTKWIEVPDDYISIDQITAILKEMYLPAMLDQLYRPSPILKYLKGK